MEQIAGQVLPYAVRPMASQRGWFEVYATATGNWVEQVKGVREANRARDRRNREAGAPVVSRATKTRRRQAALAASRTPPTRLALRVSGLPLFLACGQSAAPVAVPIETEGTEARTGTAVHDVLAAHVNGGEKSAREAAEENAVPEAADEIELLARYGRQLWLDLQAAFPAPMVEKELEVTLGRLRLVGHTDVLSLAGDEADTVRVLDWKSGRKARDYFDQLAGYALLGCLGMGCTRAQVTTAWLREGEAETRTLETPALQAFLKRLQAAVDAYLDGRAPYVVGDQCAHCPRFAECPARAELVDATRRALGDVPARAATGELADNIRQLAAQGRLSMLYAGLQCIEKAAREFRDQLRLELDKGALQEPDGRLFYVKETNQRALDPALAWPVAREYLTDAELRPAVRLSLSVLEDQVKAKAPRGVKGQAAAAFARALDEAGAIKREPRRSIAVKEPQPEGTNHGDE